MFGRLLRFLRLYPQSRKQQEYPALARLMLAYLHQDRNMETDTIPEVIANYARSHAADREQLLRDMEEFTQRFRDCLNEAFVKWWQLHIEMGKNPKTAVQFFDMIRSIVANPEGYWRFE